MTEHETLAQALVAALSELTVVEKGRTAKIPTKDGKSYTYDYADIGDVVKLTRPKLAEHGLVALTPVHDYGNGLACTVKLVHVSGETLDLGPFPFDSARDAQSTGSAVTYFRRYALVAALGMAAGDDDDGHKAKAEQRETRPAGLPIGAAKTKLVEHLTGKVPEPVKDHAAAVWEEANPATPVDEDGMAALLKVADEYLADLEAMRPEQPELVP